MGQQLLAFFIEGGGILDLGMQLFDQLAQFLVIHGKYLLRKSVLPISFYTHIPEPMPLIQEKSRASSSPDSQPIFYSLNEPPDTLQRYFLLSHPPGDKSPRLKAEPGYSRLNQPA
jgi:hypothetical protein